jgi:hypothetical protein
MGTTNTSRPASGTDPAEIARQLTSAMRDVMSDVDAAGFVVGRRDTLRALARRGLCGHPRYDFAEVTSLGRAVHAVLKLAASGSGSGVETE